MSARRQVPLQIAEADPHACTHDVRIGALGRAPLFAGLSPDQLADVDARCAMRGVEPGEAVYLAGQPARRLYVVAQGVAKLTRATPDGDEVLLDVAGSGDFLGVLPALGEERYVDSAWALTPGCLLSLGSEALDAVLGAYPEVARAGLAAVSRRLRDAQAMIHRFAAATAEQRVAATLLLLADRLGVRRPGRVVVNAPLGREELAGLAGCAPETASRVLARLRRDGIIDTGRRWVAVRDRVGLEALAA